VEVSRTTQELPSAVTMAAGARAAEPRARGVDLPGFEAGEPDFGAPDYIKDAAIKDRRAARRRYVGAFFCFPDVGAHCGRNTNVGKITGGMGFVCSPE
jgi:aspartate/methionine/tyrosine aminotransferase